MVTLPERGRRSNAPSRATSRANAPIGDYFITGLLFIKLAVLIVVLLLFLGACAFVACAPPV